MSLLKTINDGEKLTPYRLLMMAAWVAYPIIYYVGIFTSKMSLFGIKGDFIVPLFYIILIVASFREIKHKTNVWGILIYLAFFVVYITTYVFYPQNEQYLNKEFSLFFFVVLPYIFVGMLLDIKKFKNSFTFLSIVSVATHASYQLWYVQSIVERTGLIEDMVGAYMVLPHVLFLIWIAFNGKNPFIIAAAIISALFMMALGNRGTFLCLTVFLLLFFLLLGGSKHVFFTKSLVLFAGVLVVVYLNQISLFLSNVFLDLGLSNRVFDTILNDEFLVSEGRDNIRRTIMDGVYNGPLFGYGICGDRFLAGGAYAHNFFLEIVADFGMLLGVILIVMFVGLCVKAYKNCRTREEQGFIILLIASFTGLLLSGSFLEDFHWAFLLGFSIRILSENKKYQEG